MRLQRPAGPDGMASPAGKKLAGGASPRNPSPLAPLTGGLRPRLTSNGPSGLTPRRLRRRTILVGAVLFATVLCALQPSFVRAAAPLRPVSPAHPTPPEQRPPCTRTAPRPGAPGAWVTGLPPLWVAG